MTHLTFIRYFVPDSNEFAPGWYQARNEGRTRIGNAPLSLSDALYDGPNQVIIDDNTPETNSLPVSGGKGVDEFLITRTANSVVIDDDSGANVIVFERDVVITSIERPAGSEGASVAQYVITLSSGKTITLRNPASFTFQHLGDVTRTDPISAEDFFTAYEDGFAASDASQPDITGANAAPTLVDAETATRGVAVNKAVTDITQAYLLSLFNDIDGDALSLTVSSLGSIGLSYNSTDGITGTPTNPGLYTVKVVATDGNGGSAEKTLKIAVGEVVTEDDAGARFTGTTTGNISSVNFTFGSFDLNSRSGRWTYTLNSTKAQRLKAGEQKTDIITFSDGTAVIVTVLGRNDAPVVDTAIRDQSGAEGQETVINLSNLFSDIDTGDTLTLSVTVELDGNEIVFDGSSNIISDPNANKMLRITLANTGTYRVTVVADDGNGGIVGSTFNIVVEADNPPVIGGVVVGTIAEDAASPITGPLTITDADGDAVPTVMLSDGAGQYGTLTFVASAEGGVWTYTLNNANAAVQALGKDDTLTDDFTFTAEGAPPITVTITISGVNDAPELVPGAEIEDQDGNVGQLIDPISESDLRARFVDADTDNAALVLTVMVLASDGTRSGLDTIGLGYNSTDGITGTPSAAGTYTIEVTASDGEESIAFTFDIVVVHPPVIGNDSPTEIGEDAGSPITGRLTITDQDSSAPFRPIALTDDSDGTDDGIVKGEYGTLTFDSNTGAWSYMVDERAQALNDDTPGTDRFVFTSEGATDFELVITVTGTNDDPAIAMVDDGSGTGTLVSASIGDQSGTEGEDTIIDLSGVFIDPDDVLNVVPTATLDSDGTAVVFDGTNNSFSYDPDTEMLTINLADIGEYTISVEATDGGTGPAVTSEFTFTVVEQQISGDSEGSVTEDDPGNTPAMGTLTRSNASTSLELTDEGVMNDGAGTFTREGKYGTMTFVASASGGTWSYFLDGLDSDWKKGNQKTSKSTGSVLGLPVGMKFDAKQGIALQEFMNAVAIEWHRILVSGGFVLSFSQPRLSHRMALGIDDAGFEIGDIYA